MANYTPSKNFSFVADSLYAPTKNFDFEDVTPQGNLSATLDGPIGTLSAYTSNHANIAATLAGTSGDIEASIVAQGDISTTIADLSGDFVAKYSEIQGDIAATLTGPSGDIAAYVVAQGDIAATLTGPVGDIAAYVTTQGDVAATLSGPVGAFVGKYINNQGSFESVTLAGVFAGIVGNYDPNVTRFTLANVDSVQQPSTAASPPKVELPTQQALPENFDIEAEQSNATLALGKLTSSMGVTLPTPIDLCAISDTTTPTLNDIALVREQASKLNFAGCFTVDETLDARAIFLAPLQQMTKVHPDKICADVQDSANTQFDFLHEIYPDFGDGSDYAPNGVFDFAFEPAPVYVPSHNFDFGVKPSAYTATDHNLGATRSEFYSQFTIATRDDIKSCFPVDEAQYPPPGETPWVDDPRPDPDPDPPGGGGETLVVPTQEVYRMQNAINVTLDDDVTVLTMGKISLSLDADSHTWKFSGNLLDPADAVLVKQATDGTPVELHITINTYVWHVIVERISTNRKFGSKAVSISGRGLSGLLSKPYQQPASVNFGTLLTVQQIADNTSPVGWANTWSTVTWNVDAGAYSYNQKTPIDALKEIADNIGAMIIPHPSTKVLEFKPRYPVLPWDFAGTAVDVQIPDSAITELTVEPIANYQGNGVYIHGDEIGGELAFVKLNGTAGDRLLGTVNNALMTDAIGLRALGERKLASQAAQPSVKSVTTFMDGTIVPFVNVGTFVGLDVDGTVEKGIVNAVSISASHATVEQTLSIGESTPNAWVAFAEILPKDPMLVATLSSTDGTTSLMLMLDGGIVRVRGTGTVSNKYYIRSGEIVSDAPNQTLSNIVV